MFSRWTPRVCRDDLPGSPEPASSFPALVPAVYNRSITPPAGNTLMLIIGRQRQRTCAGLTRREVLQVGASTALGLSLIDLLRARAQGSTGGNGSAKSVVLLWLW